MNWKVRPLTATIGAEVAGVALGAPQSDDAVAELRRLLRDHHVLFFRDQALTPAQQVALARRFGEIDVHAFGPGLPELPEVMCLDQTEPERDGANRWHTDSTFLERPPLAGVLRAVKLPSVGSDTCWASMPAAYDRLSSMLQRTLEELTATHDIIGPLKRAVERGQSIGDLDEIRASRPPRSHPVVCRHPETGRKFLYVNSNYTTRIDQLSEVESEALLHFLFGWVQTPEIQVRFRWEEGSVAIWDNRCTQHFAVADYRERRIMHRVSVAGDWVPSSA
ncbi:MAG: TauD/TfdA family dioxygenase [Proteobacteria bacterium]|nr:TauD/TfdA family dioxygenase [Pseudomonadota bacterium]